MALPLGLALPLCAYISPPGSREPSAHERVRRSVSEVGARASVCTTITNSLQTIARILHFTISQNSGRARPGTGSSTRSRHAECGHGRCCWWCHGWARKRTSSARRRQHRTRRWRLGRLRRPTLHHGDMLLLERRERRRREALLWRHREHFLDERLACALISRLRLRQPLIARVNRARQGVQMLRDVVTRR